MAIITRSAAKTAAEASDGSEATTSTKLAASGQAAEVKSTKPSKPQSSKGKKRPSQSKEQEGSVKKKPKATKGPATRNHCKELKDAVAVLGFTLEGIGDDRLVAVHKRATYLVDVHRAIASVTEAINRRPDGPRFSSMTSTTVDSTMQQHSQGQVVNPQLPAIFPVEYITEGNNRRRCHIALGVMHPAASSSDLPHAYFYDSRQESRDCFRPSMGAIESDGFHKTIRNLIRLGWAGPDADPERYQSSVAPGVAVQNSRTACGFHVVLNGWATALGLTLVPDLRMNDIFYQRAATVINGAVYGHIGWEIIEDFFRCHGFVTDAPVPEDRQFTSTVAFPDETAHNDFMDRMAAMQQSQSPPAPEVATTQQPVPITPGGTTAFVNEGNIDSFTEVELLELAKAQSLQGASQTLSTGPANGAEGAEASPSPAPEVAGSDIVSTETGGNEQSSAGKESSVFGIDESVTSNGAAGPPTAPVEVSAQPASAEEDVREASVETSTSLAELFGEDSIPQSKQPATSGEEPASAPVSETPDTLTTTATAPALTSPELETLVREFSPFPSIPSANTDPDLQEEPTPAQTEIPEIPEINVTNTETAAAGEPLASPELVSPMNTSAGGVTHSLFGTPSGSNAGSDGGWSNAGWGFESLGPAEGQ